MKTDHALAVTGGPNPLASSGNRSARRSRRSFAPQPRPGPYRLPRDASEKLTIALTDYRNRDAAFALAVFLGRFWSSRARLVRAFPIDRRALADREDLGLTEARIRGAITTLEEVGFLSRGEPRPGSAYKATADGLRRKPITFGFGPEYGPCFAAANTRVERARARTGRRPAPDGRGQHSLWLQSNSPKDKASPVKGVLMGEVARRATESPRLVSPKEPDQALEGALRRWREAGGFRGPSHVGRT